MSQHDDDFPSASTVAKSGTRYALAILFIILAVSLVAFVWRVVTAPSRMAGNVVTQVFNADHALQSYRWFHGAFQEVEAKKGQIRLSKAALEASSADRKEARRIELLGAQQVCQSLVSEYNAKATRADTVIFKNPEKFLPGNWPGERIPLPESINITACD